MQNILVTGCTRCIGLALPREFSRLGHQVVVSGRTREATEQAAREIGNGAVRVPGLPCDVWQLAEVQALWDDAAVPLGDVDIWINSAGVRLESLSLLKNEGTSTRRIGPA